MSSHKTHNNKIHKIDFSTEDPNYFITMDEEEINLWDIRNLDKKIITISRGSTIEVQFYKTSNMNLIMSNFYDIKIMNYYP